MSIAEVGKGSKDAKEWSITAGMRFLYFSSFCISALFNAFFFKVPPNSPTMEAQT